MSEIIRAHNLSFKYRGNTHHTLKDISFHLNSGESLGILGPNGGGKSTLMKILSGILKHTEGELYFFEKKIKGHKNFPYNKVSYVPQMATLNFSLPLRASEYLDYAAQSMSIKDKDKVILACAKKVGIHEKLDLIFRDMSGGEQQRILLCKALLNTPQILLLDEPTKGLDGLGLDQLLGIIENIKKEERTAVVIIDHNINQIIRHCDKVLCLNKTFHWHDRKDLLTKNVLENIYHCEFEHLLIHEHELHSLTATHNEHQFCNHDQGPHPIHSQTTSPHPFLRRKK